MSRATKFPSFISLCHKISESSDILNSDFGFGSSSPILDDNEPSTTTPEAEIDDGSAREQQQEDADKVIAIEKNKDNEKHNEKRTDHHLLENKTTKTRQINRILSRDQILVSCSHMTCCLQKYTTPTHQFPYFIYNSFQDKFKYPKMM